MPLASETSVKVTIGPLSTPCECASTGEGIAEIRVVMVRRDRIIAVLLDRLTLFIVIAVTCKPPLVQCQPHWFCV